MQRTIHDYSNALPLGPVADPGKLLQGARVSIESVEVRGNHIVATMLWEKYPHPVCHALEPDDVLLWGGDLPIEEASVEHWAEDAVVDFAWAAALPLMASRRSWNGQAIELTEAPEIDPRYLGSRGPSDGSFISRHSVSLMHRRPLPIYGHGTARWEAEGVALFDHLALSPGLPETFKLLTLAEAIYVAAAEGAHTIRSSIEVPGLELLGFRKVAGSWEVDNRFLDIDYSGIEEFVASTSEWTPPPPIQSDIERANNATYYAG